MGLGLALCTLHINPAAGAAQAGALLLPTPTWLWLVVAGPAEKDDVPKGAKILAVANKTVHGVKEVEAAIARQKGGKVSELRYRSLSACWGILHSMACKIVCT